MEEEGIYQDPQFGVAIGNYNDPYYNPQHAYPESLVPTIDVNPSELNLDQFLNKYKQFMGLPNQPLPPEQIESSLMARQYGIQQDPQFFIEDEDEDWGMIDASQPYIPPPPRDLRSAREKSGFPTQYQFGQYDFFPTASPQQQNVVEWVLSRDKRQWLPSKYGGGQAVEQPYQEYFNVIWREKGKFGLQSYGQDSFANVALLVPSGLKIDHYYTQLQWNINPNSAFKYVWIYFDVPEMGVIDKLAEATLRRVPYSMYNNQMFRMGDVTGEILKKPDHWYNTKIDHPDIYYPPRL